MTTKPRVLIVAHDDSIRELMQDVLAQQYHTAAAANALEGTDLLRAEHFDLVVLEDNMPVIRGREYLEFLEASDEFQSLPMVIISAALDLEKKIQSKRNCRFLPQPFDLDHLFEQIRGLLAPRPQKFGAANAISSQASE